MDGRSRTRSNISCCEMQVGGLTAGRLLIAQGAIEALKVGVTIALRYACARPQFGDRLIIDYLTHQRRLLPGLAATYAYQLAMLRLKVRPSATPCSVLTCGILLPCQRALCTFSRSSAEIVHLLGKRLPLGRPDTAPPGKRMHARDCRCMEFSAYGRAAEHGMTWMTAWSCM